MTIKAANRLIESLDSAINSLKEAVDSSQGFADLADPPEAFTVVCARLPLVVTVLQEIKSCVQTRVSRKESGDDGDAFTLLRKMAQDCKPLAERLDDIFSCLDASCTKPFAQRYRKAVGSGEKLEDVMLALLEQIARVAEAPFVSPARAAELRAALEEVEGVPPSLEEEKGGQIFNNWAEGIMPIHLGRGNVNINSAGGSQITGDASRATFNFGVSQMS